MSFGFSKRTSTSALEQHRFRVCFKYYSILGVPPLRTSGACTALPRLHCRSGRPDPERFFCCKNQCQPASMLYLPRSLLVEVFRFLPFTSLLALRGTCKAFVDEDLWRFIWFNASAMYARILDDPRFVLDVVGPFDLPNWFSCAVSSLRSPLRKSSSFNCDVMVPELRASGTAPLARTLRNCRVHDKFECIFREQVQLDCGPVVLMWHAKGLPRPIGWNGGPVVLVETRKWFGARGTEIPGVQRRPGQEVFVCPSLSSGLQLCWRCQQVFKESEKSKKLCSLW